jgi:hypothetical protein
MDFKELETQANKSLKLVRPHQTEENREYEEAREILRRLFPQERVVRNLVEYYNCDNEMFGYRGSFFSELLNCDGQDSLRLRRTSRITTCYCGCKMAHVREQYYIKAPESEEEKADRMAGWNVEGRVETSLLLRDQKRGLFAQINPNFERLVPGAMDEWLKMQFEAKINK